MIRRQIAKILIVLFFAVAAYLIFFDKDGKLVTFDRISTAVQKRFNLN
jgi:hypothetical protein